VIDHFGLPHVGFAAGLVIALAVSLAVLLALMTKTSAPAGCET
jgi:hypothetical protein